MTPEDFEALAAARRDFDQRLARLEKVYGPAGSKLRPPRKLSRSQHIVGLAADFPQVTAEQLPAFVREAQAAGLVAIDELTREAARRAGSLDWTGPHVHVQRYPRGQTPTRFFDETP